MTEEEVCEAIDSHGEFNALRYEANVMNMEKLAEGKTDELVQVEEFEEKDCEENKPADYELDTDVRINAIRELYYDFTMNPNRFKTAVTHNITAYWDLNDNQLRSIQIQEELFGNRVLNAEFYYNAKDGQYNLCFIYAYNNDVSEEHRIYFWEGKVIRYIGPYESKETTYNYLPSLSNAEAREILGSIDEVIPLLISRGKRELHLYGYI